ncbi:MAG: HEAT repeat domain-containing protein [Methanophagales archaeon ANME-1-THS]|nr:MAG: HEAT repeat domain-containing protein [Methanophagales archaeon ANME-1-THS]
MDEHAPTPGGFSASRDAQTISLNCNIDLELLLAPIFKVVHDNGGKVGLKIGVIEGGLEIKIQVTFPPAVIATRNVESPLNIASQELRQALKATGITISSVEALNEIGKQKPEEALASVKKLAKDKNKKVRLATTRALGEIGKEKPALVLPLAKKLAKDKDTEVREAAAITLRKYPG